MELNASLLDTLDDLDGEPDVKRVPQNIEAEQALLGAIMVNNEARDRVSGFLTAEHFFDPLHARIFDVSDRLINAGKLVSPVTLKTFFENEEPLGELSVPQYLARLTASATTVINAEEYGRTIYDLAILRQLISIGTDMVSNAYVADVDIPPSEQIAEAEQALYGLAESGKYGSGFQPFRTALTDALDMANAAYQRDGGLSGLSSGLKDLDEKLGGLQKSDLVILAGRPSMGKTALATNIAFSIARSFRADHKSDGTREVLDGGVVAFFSLEMSSEQLATRILSEQSGVSSELIRRGKISEEQFGRMVDVARDLEGIPLYIDPTGGLAIAQLSARARKIKRQHGLNLVVVDYLQLLTGSSRRASEGRVQEVTEITTGLKALAKELEVPILALSQLSRQVEQRDDKRPQLADLRESGSIEQDADVVMFVFREEYYVGRREPRLNTAEHFEWQEEMDRVTGLAEVIIGKQRHGPTGTVRLQFQSETTRFEDYVPDSHLPERFD